MYVYDQVSNETVRDLSIGIFNSMLVYMIMFLISILFIVSAWKMYTKAGKPGIASLIPIYNTIALIQIAGLPIWYILVYLIPIFNIYAILKINIEVAHKFGKSTGFGVLMALFAPIFYAILAFGSSEYQG